MRFQSIVAASLAGLLSWSAINAQEEESRSEAIIVSAAETSDGGPPVMNFQVMSADSQGGLAFFDSADGSMPMPLMSPGMAGTDPFSMLSMDGIQQEIELVDDQKQQLDEVRRDFASRIKDAMSSIHEDGGLSGDKGREIAERFEQLKQEQQAAMRDVLLPHQVERLEQIAVQQRMKTAGASGLLADKKIAEALGISEEQQKEIKSRAEELSKELQRKIEALREETREELLQTLTAEQREKLQKMMGNKFEGELGPRQLQFPNRIRRTGRPQSDSGDDKADDKQDD